MKSLREKALLAALVMLALYGVFVAMWFMNLDPKSVCCPRSWTKAMNGYADKCEEYRKRGRLIGEKQKWADAYESEKSVIPTFEGDKVTDTTWQFKLGEMAKKHHISVQQVTPGKEVPRDDVLEMPLEIKNWECALESLVKFMHELENTDEGMFDVSAINIKPSNKKGYLRGSMTVTCAYMREEE